MSEIPDSAEVLALLERGERAAAILRVMKETGADMSHAWAHVNALTGRDRLPDTDAPQVPTPPDEGQVRYLLNLGEKIKAIHFVMLESGAGLAWCKAYVDALIAEESAPARPAAPVSGTPDESRVRALLDRGEKLAAIRLVMEETGMDLRRAKDYVEALPTAASEEALPVWPPPEVPRSGPKRGFDAMRDWSPRKKALLFLGIFVLPFLFLWLLRWLDGWFLS